MPRQLTDFAPLYVVFLLTLTHCSSSDTPAATNTDSGTDTNSSDSNTGDSVSGGTITDHGTVLDYISRKPLTGITLTESGVSATTDSTGAYSLTVPKDTPMQMVLSGGDYTKTFIAEISAAVDYPRTVPIPQLALYHVGVNSFTGFDATRGVVYIVARPTGSCTTVDGGKITLNAPTDAKFEYFTDKLPDDARTEFKQVDNDTPVAAVYNVPAGAQIDVTITHPTCTQMPFPALVSGITYTGKITVEAGDANTVSIYYLQ